MFALAPYRAANRLMNRSLFDWLDQPDLPNTIRAVDKGEKYEVSAVMPGFTNDDIKIEYENGILTISAERKQEDENSLVASSFIRSVSLPEANVETAEAELKNGILTVALPKTAKATPKKIALK